VGPESAGADPGPACYRRGGPLTVTDCNVMLGKLSPDHFPAVFGPDGDAPLDAGAVRRRFDELAAQVAQATGEPLRPAAELATGFLRIAVDNMANAIKKISVQRGHDVTGYTLQCFGGAGGQHACLVADALGMRRVMVHPYAGVLSAYGMGLAEVRALRERQVDAPLSDLATAQAAVDHVSAEARAEVAAQGITEIRIIARAHLRYDGSHQPLEIPFGAPAQMLADFEAAHQQRFGFASPERVVVFEMVSAEAIGATPPNAALAARTGAEGRAFARTQVIFDGAPREVPLYQRCLLYTSPSPRDRTRTRMPSSA